jgi:hypothetical protein
VLPPRSVWHCSASSWASRRHNNREKGTIDEYMLHQQAYGFNKYGTDCGVATTCKRIGTGIGKYFFKFSSEIQVKVQNGSVMFWTSGRWGALEGPPRARDTHLCAPTSLVKLLLLSLLVSSTGNVSVVVVWYCGNSYCY